ncbi:hypothetical protein [Desulfosporosinus lacus]|uniref:hypothetical protein n=1 Tax=Desulfosporosinus lacus TaxID=329936 RepID=UPI0009348B16|nr:hypothetical protein [Desulfosporosinus lacus]
MRKRGKYIDNCINGFLINDYFWEDSNVDHIKGCPEIVSDICYLLKRQDIIREWQKVAAPYALGFIADVKDIVVDGYSQHNTY